MNSRNSNARTPDMSSTVNEGDAKTLPDPSERFLARKAKWRCEARQPAESAIAPQDLVSSRGDTTSIAFSPSSYGLKGT